LRIGVFSWDIFWILTGGGCKVKSFWKNPVSILRRFFLYDRISQKLQRKQMASEEFERKERSTRTERYFYIVGILTAFSVFLPIVHAGSSGTFSFMQIGYGALPMFAIIIALLSYRIGEGNRIARYITRIMVGGALWGFVMDYHHISESLRHTGVLFSFLDVYGDSRDFSRTFTSVLSWGAYVNIFLAALLGWLAFFALPIRGSEASQTA
jgi:hypothetical protein